MQQPRGKEDQQGRLFSLLQVQLLNLHVLNCTEPESYSQNCFASPFFIVQLCIWTVPLQLLTVYNHQSLPLIMQQVDCMLWKVLDTCLKTCLERSHGQHFIPEETMNICTLSTSKVRGPPAQTDPVGQKCPWCTMLLVGHFNEPRTLLRRWHNLWNCFPDMGNQKEKKKIMVLDHEDIIVLSTV